MTAAVRDGGDGNGSPPSEMSGMGRRTGRRWELVAVGVATLALLVVSAGQYGLTTDEFAYSFSSTRAGEWLGLLVTDPGQALAAGTIARLWDATGDEQPGLMKLVNAVAAALAGPWCGPLTAARLGTMLVVALLVAGLYGFVAGLWGKAEGAVAAASLLLMPRVFSDTHLATLDAPAMAFSFLALAAGFAYAWPADGGGRRHWPAAALTVLAFGAAVATKLNGWLVPVFLLPWALVYRRRALPGLALSLAVGGPLLFLATWPWLWHDTALRLARYAAFFSHHFPVPVLYLGQIHDLPPWHYPLVMTVITLPVVTLALAIAGLASLAANRQPAFGSAQFRRQRSALALCAWAAVVVLVPNSLPGVPKYDGVRLFLPVFPFLAVLAAAGWSWGARWVVSRYAAGPKGLRHGPALALLAAVAVLPSMQATAHFHPYQSSYYNQLVGGLPGAVRRGLPATYWGGSYFAALPYLNAHTPPNGRVWVPVDGFVLRLSVYQSLGLLRRDIRLGSGTEFWGESDLCWVENDAAGMGEIGRWLISSLPPLFVQELDGVPLVWVFPGWVGSVSAVHMPDKE